MNAHRSWVTRRTKKRRKLSTLMNCAMFFLAFYFIVNIYVRHMFHQEHENKEEMMRNEMEVNEGYDINKSRWNEIFDRLYVDDSNLTALWLGEISEDVMKWNPNPVKFFRITLVVSHCDKPLGWIWDQFLPPGIVLNRVVIYSKCGKEVIGAPDDAEIVILPNVGRCDHTYAYHLARNGQASLNKNQLNEIVLFMKDNPQRMEWWDRRSFDELLRITVSNGFGCIEQEKVFKNMYPSYYHLHSKWREFQMKGGYSREKDRDKVDVFSSVYPDLGTWADSLEIPILQPLTPVCYGGVFAASLRNYTSDRLSVWKRIEENLSRGDNIEEGHFCERIWAGLLSKPLQESAVTSLMNKKTNVMCKARWKNRCGELAYIE